MATPGFFRSATAIAVLAIVITGCKTAPRPVANMRVAPQFTGSIPPGKRTASTIEWWQQFRDPALAGLIARGTRENISTQQARQRLDILRLRMVLAGADRLPQAQASASASRFNDGLSGNTVKGTTFGAGGQFSWLLDIFGQTRSQRAAALANAEAGAADVEVVRLAYLADLVISYIDYQYFHQAIAISRQNLASFSKTLALTKEMLEEGTASTLDVAQAQALVDGARAEIPPLERDKQRAANHIATLLGTNRGEIVKLIPAKSRQPKLQSLPKAGVPADLLRQRPDIRREERLLAAATASIGIAEAQLYPSVSLTGNIDATRLIVPGLNGSGVAWTFGPTVVAPIFNGKRLRTNVDIAAADSRIQYLRWKDTVLRAVEEVENALVSVNRGQSETAALTRKVASYQTALGLARESYKGGTGVILDVLEADRSLGSARLDLAESLRSNAIEGVRLYVALGGGVPVDAPEKTATRTDRTRHPAPG